MNYEKIWNDLKEDMLVRAELERTSNDSEEYLLFASRILKKMVRAEVDEFYKTEEKKQEIDTRMMGILFPQKSIHKKEGE